MFVVRGEPRLHGTPRRNAKIHGVSPESLQGIRKSLQDFAESLQEMRANQEDFPESLQEIPEHPHGYFELDVASHIWSRGAALRWQRHLWVRLSFRPGRRGAPRSTGR